MLKIAMFWTIIFATASGINFLKFVIHFSAFIGKSLSKDFGLQCRDLSLKDEDIL